MQGGTFISQISAIFKVWRHFGWRNKSRFGKKPREITLPGFRSKTPSQIFPSVLTWGWEEQGLGQWQCISTQHLPEWL